MMTALKNRSRTGAMKRFVLMIVCLSFVFLQTRWSGAENRFTKFRQIGDPLDDKIDRDQDLKKKSQSSSTKSKKSPQTSSKSSNQGQGNPQNKTTPYMGNAVTTPTGVMYNGIYPDQDQTGKPNAQSKSSSQKKGSNATKDIKKKKNTSSKSTKDSQTNSARLKRQRISDRMKESKSPYTTSVGFDKYRENSQFGNMRSGN